MEGEAEQAQRSQRQHLQPPPLLFLSCADPFVIDNLVQDVFEKRPLDGPRVVVDFSSQDDGQSVQATYRIQSGSQPLRHLSFFGETEDKDFEAAPLTGTVVLNLTPLLSLPVATPATNDMLRRVVDWITERQLPRPYNDKGQGDKHQSLQVVLTATNPLGLWRLQKFSRLLQQQHHHLQRLRLPHQHQEEEGKSEQRLEQQGSLEEDDKTKEKEAAIPIFHLEILGPTHGYLFKQASLLLGSSSSPAPPTATSTTAVAMTVESEQGIAGTATTTVSPSFTDEEDHPPEHDQPPDQEAGFMVVDKAANALDLRHFLSLQPTLGVLSHFSEARDPDTAAATLHNLVANETERLRSAFSSTISSSGSSRKGTTTAAIILWDVLNAIHGDRIDMLSQGQIEGGTTQPRVVPLESVLQLCDNNFRILEALIAEGWVEFSYPELKGSSVTIEGSQSPFSGNVEEPEGREGSGRGQEEPQIEGDERQTVNAENIVAPSQPDLPEGYEHESAIFPEAESGTATEIPIADESWLICRGSLETLQGGGMKNSDSSNSSNKGSKESKDEEEGGLDSVPLPKWISTPAAVTMAWKTLEIDPALARYMHARADARHFVQEANVLGHHREALGMEWAELHKARMVLRERAPELSDEDFISLQLELIRLEKSAASRALEMLLRCKRLKELHEKMCGVLTAEEVPCIKLLSGQLVSSGSCGGDFQENETDGGVTCGSGEENAQFWIPIEEKVLAEMGRGLRGVPVVDVTSMQSSSLSLSSSETDQEGKGEKSSASRWMRSWWPWRKLLGR